jgi:hypothetical protein
MKNITRKLIVALVSLNLFNLSSAEQGDLVYGDKSINSTGNLNITLEIAHAIQINKLNDINLGTFKSSIDTNKIGSDKFCVFSNTDSFSLKFLGKNGNDFNLEETSNSQLSIPYTVQLSTIDENDLNSTYREVAHNETINNITETRNVLNCVSYNTGEFLPNLELQIEVKERNMLDALPGNYKDTITIIASPE